MTVEKGVSQTPNRVRGLRAVKYFLFGLGIYYGSAAVDYLHEDRTIALEYGIESGLLVAGSIGLGKLERRFQGKYNQGQIDEDATGPDSAVTLSHGLEAEIIPAQELPQDGGQDLGSQDFQTSSLAK